MTPRRLLRTGWQRVCASGAVGKGGSTVLAQLGLLRSARVGVATAFALCGGSLMALAQAQPDDAPASASTRARRVHDDYELQEKLGEGAFAVVRRAQCRKTGKKVAIKVIPITKQSADRVREEVAVLQRVSLHTCIAKFEAVYEHADEGKFYIVMEFVDGGDLLDRICERGPWSEASAARLLHEVRPRRR